MKPNSLIILGILITIVFISLIIYYIRLHLQANREYSKILKSMSTNLLKNKQKDPKDRFK